MRSIVCSKGEIITISDEDYSRVSSYKWYVAQSKAGLFYARTTSRQKIYLHRLVLEAPKGSIVDHIDGDTFNCTRKNLRFVSSLENATNKKASTRNKLGIKGVSFDKHWNKYVAQLNYKGVKYREWFTTKEEAKDQYDTWSREIHTIYGRT